MFRARVRFRPLHMITSPRFSRAANLSARWSLAAAAWALAAHLRGASLYVDSDAANFTDRYCSSCHNDVDKDGGLDLTSLKYDPSDGANFLTWVKIHDRVQAGEMPPKEKKRPAAKEIAAFVSGVDQSLQTSEQVIVAEQGRATRRRLNRSE